MKDREGRRVSVRELLTGRPGEEVRAVPWWRQVLPWVITGLILLGIFSRIEFAEFLYHFSEARLFLLIPAMLGFTLVYAAGDVLSYGNCYRWFVTPAITVREIVTMRWGVYLLHALYTPLSTAANLVYLRRTRGAPVIWTLSANAFTSVHDLFTINAVVTAALLMSLAGLSGAEVDPRWLYAASVPWLVALGYAGYWFTPVKEFGFLSRVTETPILRSCRLAAARHHLIVLGARLMVAAGGVAAHWLAFIAFGMEVPAQMALLIAPLMVGASFMPVSSAGFGGPQLVALILLPYAHGDHALVAAYSLSFSALFTLGRSIIGFVFMPGMLRDLADPPGFLTNQG